MRLVVVLSYEVPDAAAGNALAQIMGQVLDQTSQEPIDIKQAAAYVAVGDVADRIAAEFNH